MTTMTSTVPTVWAALHAALTAALDVPVHYGPPVIDPTTECVCVGYVDSGEAVSGDSQPAGLGRGTREEAYNLSCLIWTTSGDLDMAARVARAYEMLATCAGVLAADPSLGGACRIAAVTEQALTVTQGQAGATATLRFVVTVAARVTAVS